ncbi:MAG: hypothetical protein M1838_000185 [Thelocarpon superellum]|nr:MAG: hypothetical protein M1838_000185 [Thelocarpon superellum]
MANKAEAFKLEGNKHFKAGDWKAAEHLYSQAIMHNSTNPLYFTNRALTRLNLQAWDAAINDCLKSIELMAFNMKAYYYLAQAQVQLHHPNEALSSALTAYDMCLRAGNSADASSISALVLRAKKEKWEVRERERLRRRSELLAELEDRLEMARRDEVTSIMNRVSANALDMYEAEEERIIVDDLSNKKVQELRSTFALSDPENLQTREVPDYLIDNISFAIMHDPVVTKTGQSYERSTLIEHLRRSETDPLTREPLRVQDLRPNLALRQACAEFLETNGWAVDW